MENPINPNDNPYVGPRTFNPDEAHLFFGREEEAQTLLSLVTINRLVLFYAPSGAGKSSLINTRLIPNLRDKGFEILPVGRVSGQPIDQKDKTNVFGYNLMLRLEQSGREPDYLADLELPKFLAGLLSDEATEGAYRYEEPPISRSSNTPNQTDEDWPPRALIIDQFEEVLTTHLDRWEQRTEFFKQLAESLHEDPFLWLVLVMRSDYVAGLDRYSSFFPDHLRTRYPMELMGHDEALEAIKQPLLKQKRFHFSDDAANKLIKNLSRIRVEQYGPPSTETTYISGEFVEPVQLQLVCYQLWGNLARREEEKLASS
ncbi:hypothetical protein QUF63_02485 [Anaerolineales bacterium HSG25]|nr:hypothetical protein [Anaerolineales bacterium HSG25]